MSGMLKGRGMRRPKAWRGCFLRLALVRMQNFSGNRIYFWVACGIYIYVEGGRKSADVKTNNIYESKRKVFTSRYMKVNIKYSPQTNLQI